MAVERRSAELSKTIRMIFDEELPDKEVKETLKPEIAELTTGKSRAINARRVFQTMVSFTGKNLHPDLMVYTR